MSLLPLYNLLTSLICKSSTTAPPLALILGEYPPYYSQHLSQCGKIPEILSTILTKHNIAVQYNWVPWARAYEGVHKRKYQGTFVEKPSSHHDNGFYFSDPILYNELVFFHQKRTPMALKNVTDLNGVRSGATLRSNYPRTFLEAGETGQISIDWSSDDVLNISKLLKGIIDVFPVSKEVGLYKLQNYFSPQDRAKLTWSPPPLTSIPVRLMLSKAHENSKQIVELINCELKRTILNSSNHFKS